METGESGANGAHALRRAKKENNQELVNVIHLLLSTVERYVKESQLKVKFATGTSLAQVSLSSVFSIWCFIEIRLCRRYHSLLLSLIYFILVK